MQSSEVIKSIPICAYQVSDTDRNLFALLDEQQALHLYSLKDHHIVQTFQLTMLHPSNHSSIYFSAPYIAVAETFGLNAAVIDTDSGYVMRLSRENYHSDVCSFALGFVRHNNKTLLMHQTQWNRLDVTDPATGTLLTQRTIDHSQQKNYLDYFHSRLHISPGKNNFLINGWIWGPQDNVRCGEVGTFLNQYEPSTMHVDYSNGYNWDRPATFINDDVFVIGVDDPDPALYDEDEILQWIPRRLQFYNFKDAQSDGLLPQFKMLDGDWFEKVDYGEVKGQLHYAPSLKALVAISSKGIFAIDLQGQLLAEIPLENPAQWMFSTEHEMLYRLHDHHMQTVALSKYL